MTRRFEVRAPAKINLGLRIRGRRADGYHELESLFAPLDLADALTLSLAAGGPAVRLLDGGGPVPAPLQGNLAARAAEAFLVETGLALRVEISLAKQIPLAAGLGGGSSDAAAVLRCLAAESGAALPRERLAALALALGADVPFFLDPRPARVRGIGERIDPCPRLPALPLLLAGPGAPLATGEVFATFDRLAPRAGPPEPPDPVTALSDSRSLAALLHNDLEAAARELRPELGDLRRRLEDLGALAVGMSGSGPTFYGVFASPAAARAAGEAARRAPGLPWSRVAATLEAG